MRIRRLVRMAWKSLWLHRLRSLLTVLGIVFGVMSVISMLAIGEGVKEEAQAQIRQLGASNLILASVKPPEPEGGNEGNARVLAYGLLRRDLEAIRLAIPEVRHVVPRRDVPVEAWVGHRKVQATCMGTEPEYLAVAGLRLAGGRFLTRTDGAERAAVCVLGAEVARRLFDHRDPVGELIKAGTHTYRVVGTLAARGEGTGGTAGVGGESDMAVFVPLPTLQERTGDLVRVVTSGSMSSESVELHRITVQAVSADEPVVQRVAQALRALIRLRHDRKEDVRLTVPQELLRQARESKRIFTILLACIAAISLLVGGIGIMNIMLATVVERTREIGVRRALGAARRHIVAQFLAETVLLSVGGGALGVGLGLLLPQVVTWTLGMPTLVLPEFLVLAFGISALVGVVFGLYPAARAADLDPVEALRHE